MDVSLEPDVNYSNSRPILRGSVDPTVSQASPPVDISTLQYISEAIKDGDRLPNTEASLGAKTQRRALIVAPQYQVHFTKYEHLPATLNDVYNVHKMLTQRGYDKANIRILVDSDGGTDPTRDNIIKSLEWLVSNAQPGDYRFFHFSGHGTYILSTSEEGKEALRIPEQQGGLLPADHELNVSSNRSMQYTRVSSLQVKPQDIRYYNEAIVTSYKSLPLLDTLTKDITEYNMIRDSVLNHYFSKLPERCKLTCTLDCCHSGRLINNNFKLAGAGFRGRCTYSSVQGRVPEEPPEVFTQMDDLIEQLGKQTLKDLSPPEDSTARTSVSTPAEGTSLSPGASIPEDPLLGRGAKTSQVQAAIRPPSFSSSMTQNYTSPPLVSKIMELLPAEEANRDKIKADMLTWTGCHQRQGAVDYSDLRGGLFTRSFTESVMENSNSVTVGQLYDKLNQRIANEARNFRDGRGQIRPVLQYAQVWTSCRKGDEARAREKLYKEFSI